MSEKKKIALSDEELEQVAPAALCLANAAPAPFISSTATSEIERSALIRSGT